MINSIHSQMVSFIWNIACDCLVNVFNKSDYRKVILPMIVIRRLDAVLEPTKQDVLKMKEMLVKNKFTEFSSLRQASKQAFYNDSPFVLKDLKNRNNIQTLKLDFIAYLDGFSENVQDIISKFKFRDQIDALVDGDTLGLLIEKFVDPRINLSNQPVYNADGSEKLPALDNHSMGTIFEELLRRFNEENNVTEAGEHFTPRDVVDLMTDFAFIPIQDKIKDGTYLVYDGACGTGGMLTEADRRLKELAIKVGKKVSIHLFGQESAHETYATCRSDLLLKGEGEESDNIFFGSTISNDGFAGKTFDFCISNPPFGTPWKKDAEVMGGKGSITDTRFVTTYKEQPEFRMIPNVGDPQLLFLLNNVSKMKYTTELGSRIIEVHNGSSLFTGDAGSGESNARRYLLENDLVEAIVALPEKIFYNTGIGTYIWILTNKKEDRRKGKVQLIDATSFKKTLKKNLGERNCEINKDLRKQIVKLLVDFQENEYSKIFDNSDFGYYSITVQHPQMDEKGKPIKDKRGNYIADKDLKDTEQVPMNYMGGIQAFFEKEVLPYSTNAWIDEKGTKIGYEISFTKVFYKPVELRTLEEIAHDLGVLEAESDGLMEEILRG